MQISEKKVSLPSGLPKWLFIVVLGMLSMLMPLSIDMYLPSMPTIARNYQVADGYAQLTISIYLFGFAIGQLIYGPLSDSFGRKKIMIIGLILFIIAATLCGLSPNINQLIAMRFFHGLAAASTAVIINAFMRDIFSDRDEFSRMTSFVTLISNLAPLLAPIIGGFILIWFEWRTIFYVLSFAALITLILFTYTMPETLTKEKRVSFNLALILRNFVIICRHPQVLKFVLVGAFSSAGLFSFLSLGSFVYMNIYDVKPEQFGYYFALNILFLVTMNIINSRYVSKKGALSMLKLGMIIQTMMALYLLIVISFHLGFIALVIGVAGYIGCMSIIGGNAMAITLSYYPYMAGTAASLAGTFRFVIAAFIGIVLAWLSNLHDNSVSTIIPTHRVEYFMVGSMIICNLLAGLFFVLAKANLLNEASK
ncbi:MAG: Bcr/CflA family multidrug efflux MFS transporter [Candidatus Schmidhempelia sp.]|nr:Bcr/CflA family multidrug efflux MFS transporter [Candidatus Schmidhempelia sp.]